MDPTQLQPGYRLDRYELLCPLAYGGMASVWLARFGGRLGFERMVVVKMILPQYSQDPRFQEMFLDEARIASKIEHSNVARILDIGEHQHSYFIVMEWVDGDSLSKVLRAADHRKQRIPPGVALRVIADAAAGLHAAHELKDRDGNLLGVVHRDVSPQNILIANNGTTMIIDFGVAKARDRVSQETSAGQLKGKIRYMAPEQALGRAIDRRADVWALGAILYEILTGQPPYDGPNEVATLHKLTSGQPPPPMPRSTPEVVRAVVERALCYEPENRFSTALEMNLALEGAMVEINEPTTAAIVAHYTGQLLAERKAARKRAVDAALEAARKRDAGQFTSAPSLPLAAPSTGQLPLPAPSSPATVPLYNESPSLTSEPSAPSISSASNLNGPMSLGEVPSTTSSATLGSAAIEYPPEPSLPFDLARRKRYTAAVALGVSVAAGVVGVVLIVSAMKHDGPTTRSSEPPAKVSTVTGSAPSSTVDLDLSDPSKGATASTSSTPETTPTATLSATTTATAVPTATATTTETATTSTAQVEPPSTKAHKPPPPPAPRPRPTAPGTTPSSTKVDRGF